MNQTTTINDSMSVSRAAMLKEQDADLISKYDLQQTQKPQTVLNYEFDRTSLAGYDMAGGWDIH